MSFELDESLGILIANVRNSLKNHVEKELLPYNITPAQRLIILRLCEKDDLTQRELAQDTYFKQSSLTLLLDKLERNGLIIRKPKNDDRRAYLIGITPKGRELKDILINIGDETEEKALEGIKGEDIEILTRTLKKMYKNLKEK